MTTATVALPVRSRLLLLESPLSVMCKVCGDLMALGLKPPTTRAEVEDVERRFTCRCDVK